jgi:hypothetical protein
MIVSLKVLELVLRVYEWPFVFLMIVQCLLCPIREPRKRVVVLVVKTEII